MMKEMEIGKLYQKHGNFVKYWENSNKYSIAFRQLIVVPETNLVVLLLSTPCNFKMCIIYAVLIRSYISII